MSLLTFTDVHKDYSKEAIAIANISFSVISGEFTALAGPSGSGKTTVLNLAAGLDKASRGNIRLLDHDLQKMNSVELTQLRRNHVGFIFQAYNLFPVLTAIENVEYPLALRNTSPKERRERSMEALEEVGLADYANRFPSQLSGGQQQRVAIARAMITKPRIIFADEPTANLDSKSAEKLLLLFRQLNEEKQTTFLFSSHDPKVLDIAKRIIKLSDGKIVHDPALKRVARPMFAPVTELTN